MLRRNSLPKPLLSNLADSINSLNPVSVTERLVEVNKQRTELVHRIAHLNLESEMLALSICGNVNDSQEVEFYDGSLGVSQELVRRCARPVGMLQWLDDLEERFSHPGETAGNVSRVGWGTGALISNDLFLTASHCFDRHHDSFELPRRNNVVPDSHELAVLMRVLFNFQLNGETNLLRPAEAFPILALLEYHDIENRVDYAILRLGRNESGALPGERFGFLPVAQENVTAPGTMLCLIQHPNGDSKKIEAGPMLCNTGSQIRYQSIDTLGASSGAPLLSEAGEIVGVHTNGGCTQDPGSFNFGAPIKLIRAASQIL